MALKTLPKAWRSSVASLDAGVSLGGPTVERSKGSEEAALFGTSRTGTTSCHENSQHPVPALQMWLA